MRTLSTAGRIEIGRYHHPTPIDWKNRWVYLGEEVGTRKMLMGRLPLTAEEAEIERQERAEFEKKLAALAAAYS